MKNLKRGAARYIEIENFKDYELTPCVAYEMAIRSPAFIKTVQAVIDFYHRHEETINELLSLPLEERFGGVDDADIAKKIENESMLSTEFYDLLRETMFYQEEEGALLHPSIAEFNEELFQILKKVDRYARITAEGETVFHDDSKKIRGIRYSSLDSLMLTKSIQRAGYTVFNTGELREDELIYTIEDPEDIPPLDSLEKVREAIEADRPGLFTSETTIYPAFSRPVLYGNQLKSRRVSLELNLSLPINELVAYLKHIKRDQDKTPDMTAAPIELLGESLGAADYEVCMSNGKCFDARRHLSKQEKLADMFFIYDGIKAGMKKSQIIDELFDYQLDKTDDIAKTVRVDPKTLNRYYQIASEYIDGEKYKELTTGTSVKK